MHELSKNMNTSTTPTPLQLRAELEKMVRQDLLGPKGGPEEEIIGRGVSVRGRYIVIQPFHGMMR